MKTPLQILILAGGVGTRLWPMSRKILPKQFQPLVGDKTLFQLAVSRAKKITSTKNIFVATNQEFTKLVRTQAKEIPVRNIISEPAFRDTATCLGYAATVLENRNPGGVFAVVYADNLIQNEKEFTRKVRAAAEIAETGKFAIIEVESSFPSTQYGWVEAAKALPKVRGEKVFELKRFVEKPKLPLAKKFHASKKFFWNTGLYVWRSDVLLSKFQAHLPRTFGKLQKISKNLNSPKVIKKEYSVCEKISIDFGVMEKINPKEVAILPAKLGWSDVGSWESLKNELSKENENLVDGEFQAVGAKGNFIKVDSKKFVALVGVDDLVVVETEDALLICQKEKSGEVKNIVRTLEKKGKLL
jgi:mannose-1-phosphate guanylyltransferase